jgi:hypothetical protein
MHIYMHACAYIHIYMLMQKELDTNILKHLGWLMYVLCVYTCTYKSDMHIHIYIHVHIHKYKQKEGDTITTMKDSEGVMNMFPFRTHVRTNVNIIIVPRTCTW